MAQRQQLTLLIFLVVFSSRIGFGQTDGESEWDELEDFTNELGEDQSTFGSGLEFHGFVSTAISSRVRSDGFSRSDLLLGEARGRLDLSVDGSRTSAQLMVDFVGDGVSATTDVDIRQASVTFSLADWLGCAVGRQSRTWGTGDLLFLNDLFPKDFQAFFLGRADEFLKAPVNALSIHMYTAAVGVDVVWAPVFSPDRFITGERLTFFFLPDGSLVGDASELAPLEAVVPELGLVNSEWFSRVYGVFSGWEFALYGYLGFFKQPLRFDPEAGSVGYARMASAGGSIRGTLGAGVAHLEASYYHSLDDSDGRDPFSPNSQARALVGYERELWSPLTVGLQYYLEATLFHDRLLKASPFADLEPDEFRHVLTLRVTYVLLSDTLHISLFGFVSPTDIDGYIRSSIAYAVTDELRVTMGTNIFLGLEDFTFFGQLETNSNAYLRVRYSF